LQLVLRLQCCRRSRRHLLPLLLLLLPRLQRRIDDGLWRTLLLLLLWVAIRVRVSGGSCSRGR
jgi:hypothetical protein